MTKAFLISLVILTFAAFGVATYVINQNSITVDEEAQKISPATLNRSLPDGAKTKNNGTTPDAPVTGTSVEQVESCVGMTYQHAVEVATAGGCGKDAKLKDTHACNEITKTWWIDMDLEKEGCYPACVVSVETGTAEINWRCTGAIAPEPNALPAESKELPQGTITNR